MSFFVSFLSVCKLFHKACENETGSSFVLLIQSRNAIGRLKKTYLHKPIEIGPFLPAKNFKKNSHNFKIFLYFQQCTTYKMGRVNNKEFSYMLFLFALQFHVFTYFFLLGQLFCFVKTPLAKAAINYQQRNTNRKPVQRVF